jgi:hypothetical protein
VPKNGEFLGGFFRFIVEQLLLISKNVSFGLSIHNTHEPVCTF